MVFLVLNVIISISLIAFSFTIDTGKKNQTNNTAVIVNSTLFLAALFALMAITLAMCFFAPQQLALSIGKLMYLIMGWFSVNCCVFLYLFSDKEFMISCRLNSIKTISIIYTS